MDERYISDVIDFVDELTGNRYEIYSSTQEKNNSVVVHGICIHNKDSNISPIIQIDGFFEDGMTAYETAVKVVERFNDIKETQLSFDVEMLLDYNAMQDKIAFKLVNRGTNAGLLEESPYAEVLDDLALVYYLELGYGTIPITDTLMEIWGVTEDDLFQSAEMNTPVIHPPTFQLMNVVTVDMEAKTENFYAEKYDMGCEFMTDEEFKQMLIESMDDGNSLPVYILRGGNTFGASVLMYEDILKSIHEYLENDFYVFPSSVYELVVLPYDEAYDIATIKNIVRFVDKDELDPEDYLSDSVYFFDEKGLAMISNDSMLQNTIYEDSRFYDEAR